MNYIKSLIVVCVCLLVQEMNVRHANAADHLDGPTVVTDPAADITDVYAWMQDSTTINLILNVFPLADSSSQFSDGVRYVFNIRSLASYGGEGTSRVLSCEFSTDQLVTCELDGNDLVANVSASSPEGVLNADGVFRIFAGPRNDPFFFDLTNFNTVRTTVRDAAASLDFDEAGCPLLDQATQDVLVSTLTGAGGLPGANSPASDFFSPLNVLSIVIQADRNLFGPGPLYSVSAATFRK